MTSSRIGRAVWCVLLLTVPTGSNVVDDFVRFEAK